MQHRADLVKPGKNPKSEDWADELALHFFWRFATPSVVTPSLVRVMLSNSACVAADASDGDDDDVMGNCRPQRFRRQHRPRGKKLTMILTKVVRPHPSIWADWLFLSSANDFNVVLDPLVIGVSFIEFRTVASLREATQRFEVGPRVTLVLSHRRLSHVLLSFVIVVVDAK